jgi:hypothetical protein
VYALDATHPVPGTPSPGTVYRDTTLTTAAGLPFAALTNTAILNEYLYRISILADAIDKAGILCWNPAISYQIGAIVLAQNDLIYRCIQAGTNHNPDDGSGIDTAYWQRFGALASDAETIAGTITNKAVTPHGLAAAFAASKGASGYQKLEGGLTMQWGTIITGNTFVTSEAVNFPVAFATACIGIVVTPALNIHAASNFATISRTVNGFTLVPNQSSKLNLFWIALGY